MAAARLCCSGRQSRTPDVRGRNECSGSAAAASSAAIRCSAPRRGIAGRGKRVYARQAKDTELIEKATEIKVRAECRAGEMLWETEKAVGSKFTVTAVDGNDRRPAPTLSQLGITKDQSSRYQRLAAMPKADFEAAIETAKAVAGQVSTAFMLKRATAARLAPTPSARPETSTSGWSLSGATANCWRCWLAPTTIETPQDRISIRLGLRPSL